MAFPNTPVTLVGRLQQNDSAQLWNASWAEFFDLYHSPVRFCVAGAFHRYRWHDVGEELVDDVTLRVFDSLVRAANSSRYNASKGRFRHFLSSVCQRRVIDYIREHKNDGHLTSVEGGLGELKETLHDPFYQQTENAFTDALLGTLLAALRSQVSPRIYMIFELVKLAGEEPAGVAEQLGTSRSVVDNSIFKAMQKLREIARSPEIQKEISL
jgi:RNA polymerase sigma factor (sigma-70 family)